MTDVLIKRGNLDTGMHHGNTRDDKGRDQIGIAEAKEYQRMTINHQKLRKRSLEQVLPQSLQKKPVLWTHYFKHTASITLRKQISVV